MKLFVFGCGYSAGAFVKRLPREAVLGATTRSSDKAASLAAHGIQPFLFDGEHPGQGIDGTLERATHLLVSIAPGPAGDPVLRQYRDRIRHGMPALRWIGYLSTVGVYGDHRGAWVDEETPVAPVSKRSVERVAAEADWMAVAEARGTPLATLRLSGIYGPGRNAFVNLREGKARRLVKKDQVFNRIHVEDIAGALLHLTQRNESGIFNVTDSEPAPPQDVVELAADIAKMPVPPAQDFDEADLTPMARSFYGENKRVSNAKIRASGYTFLYPTYRDALPCLIGDAAISPSPNISVS